jgi:predicted lipoprotein with Yx(FWY)xxD motif
MSFLHRVAGRGTLAVVATAAIVGACAAPGATAGPTVAPATNPPATQAPATNPPMSVAPATPAPTAAAELTLATGTDATLGEYVTGAEGMTLYLFTPDADAPGKSVCNGDCATAWPPLTVEAAGDVAPGAGFTGVLGTVTRDDGTLQVTLGGWPLYYYAADQAAGDITGQGVGGVWYLIGPDGEGIGVPATSGELQY